MIRPVAADGRIETGGAFTPIYRPRIVERIASAASQRIALIVAPAGYGKSVALRQYLDEIADAHIRYDVRPEHSNLLGFVRGFADALLDVAPDARKSVSIAYEKSRSSKTPGSDLALWMQAHIKTFSGIIAIDDLHVAESDPEISKFLVALIERTKGRARWIIASRSSLDLPVGSWLAYGDMDLNVDEQDLQFNVDEARIAAKHSRVAVREEELGQILDMTEGWPTAVSFALRSSTRSVDLRNIAANTREMVYRYLAEQVYNSLSQEERQILHFVAFLPEIHLGVVKKAGYNRAKAVIEEIRDRVAFIYPERPDVYRCHDLFREFLQHQVELEGDAALAAVQRRVAEALESCGEVAPALDLYVQMRSDADVLRMLDQYGFSLLEQAHGDLVSAALESISQEARATHPVALALRGLREADDGRFDRAESLLSRAISSSNDAVVGSELSVRLGQILFNQSRDAIALLEPIYLDESLPDNVRAKATSLLAPAYAYAGRKAESERAMKAAESFAFRTDSDEIRARLYHRMGLAAFSLRFSAEEVYALFQRACSLANECGLFVTAAAAYAGLMTTALFYEDDLSKGTWYAQQSFAAALKAGDRFSLQNAILYTLDFEARRGNVDRVIALEHQFSEYATSDSSRSVFLLPPRSMLCAWQGRFDEAFRLLSLAPDGGLHFTDKILFGALQALYALGDDKREISLKICSRTIEQIGSATWNYLYERRVIEIARVLCGIVEALSGRVTAAQKILAKTGDLEVPTVAAIHQIATAICRMARNPVFETDATESIENLRSLGWGGIGLILEQVLGLMKQRRTVGEGPLTPTEMDVLENLAAGLSPKDIAQETGRSVYTIQAHIQNIIKKLGCSGRSEALMVARRKGLLKFN